MVYKLNNVLYLPVGIYSCWSTARLYSWALPFLINITDIDAKIGSNIRLIADDTRLYIIFENPATSAGCLNSDLTKISIWANNWLVDFNPIITESMSISRKLNKPVDATSTYS